MKNQNRRLILIISFLIFNYTLISCSPNPTISVKTPIERAHPNLNFNQYIELERINSIYIANKGSKNIPKVVSYDDDIGFDLFNKSNYEIQFPADWGIHEYAFNKNNKEWIMINDRLNYVGHEPLVLLPRNSSDYLPGFFRVKPEPPSELHSQKIIPIRIIIIGKVVSKKQSDPQSVGAYYDLYFKP